MQVLRWSLQHDLVTLPKSTRQERMIENASVDGFELSDDDMAALDALDERLVTDWYVNSRKAHSSLVARRETKMLPQGPYRSAIESQLFQVPSYVSNICQRFRLRRNERRCLDTESRHEVRPYG